MDKPKLPEPWLRGTFTEVDAVRRAVLHALELAKEDIARWCGDLSDEEMNVRPSDLGAVGFHIRHIVGSIDRLLSYAEGKSLSVEQIALMKKELDPGRGFAATFAELQVALDSANSRIRAIPHETLGDARTVGRQQMPTTVAGLIIHVADHTQRHVGQAITTAKMVKSRRQR